jgi:hypothetical protein
MPSVAGAAFSHRRLLGSTTAALIVLCGSATASTTTGDRLCLKKSEATRARTACVTAKPSPATRSRPGSRTNPLRVGRSFALTTAWGAIWTVQVAGYTANAWLLIQRANMLNFSPPTGYRYVMILYNLTYDGPGAFTANFLPDDDLDVVDAAGLVHSYIDTTHVIVPPHPRAIDYISAQFGPGTTISFNVVYEVATSRVASLVGLAPKGLYFALS